MWGNISLWFSDFGTSLMISNVLWHNCWKTKDAGSDSESWFFSTWTNSSKERLSAELEWMMLGNTTWVTFKPALSHYWFMENAGGGRKMTLNQPNSTVHLTKRITVYPLCCMTTHTTVPILIMHKRDLSKCYDQVLLDLLRRCPILHCD